MFSPNQLFSVLFSVLFGAERAFRSQVQIKTSSSVRYILHPGNMSPAGENDLYQINTGSHKVHWFKTTGLKPSSSMDLNPEF